MCRWGGVNERNVPAVQLRDVDKAFEGVQALSGLSFDVATAQITVLLGPNGAGKTTAIRCITGALPPSAGTVHTFGLDPVEHGAEIRQRCGVVSAKPALYDRLDGWDNLMFAAKLYNVPGNKKDAIREAASRFAIEHALDQQVGGYSTGMKTRLALTRAVLHRPDMLILDEPTSGLDPESSQAVLQMIREFTADGTTVIMCTHLLVEAEGLADQIVMLDEGTKLLNGSQEGLIDHFWPDAIVKFGAERPEALDMLKAAPGVLEYQRPGPALVQLDSLDRIPDLIASLTEAGARLTSVEPHQPSLEELYFEVRKQHRENKAGGEASRFPSSLAEATTLRTTDGADAFAAPSDNEVTR